MNEYVARFMGIDITTTELAVAVRSNDGQEGYASLPMRGATYWNDNPGYPAFDLSVMPGMLLVLLRTLQEEGWRFDQGGSLSVSCRQHDLVLLDRDNTVRGPAISWECNAATAEAEALNAVSWVQQTVGRVEPRLIVAKLPKVLRADPALAASIAHVMTTGDWVAYQLTGQLSLHTSEAQSNGLFDCKSRRVAAQVLVQANIDPGWLPPLCESGHLVGEVSQSAIPGSVGDRSLVKSFATLGAAF